MAPTDPRLAALYDTDNPDGPDHDHFRSLANRIGAKTIIDLGCGTGILTVTLATPGRTVIGIDPDIGMLEVARHRPGHARVSWTAGDSRKIGRVEADLLIMSGNVAQHIGPDDWARTLDDIASGLRAGGVVSFETRNPDAEAWRQWTKSETYAERATPHGPLVEWLETSGPDRHGTVMLTAHNVWPETGEELKVPQPLTFRSADQVVDDLLQAGLTATARHGGWQQEQITEQSQLLVFEATKD